MVSVTAGDEMESSALQWAMLPGLLAYWLKGHRE